MIKVGAAFSTRVAVCKRLTAMTVLWGWATTPSSGDVGKMEAGFIVARPFDDFEIILGEPGDVLH
jgi:hypothetical protein